MASPKVMGSNMAENPSGDTVSVSNLHFILSLHMHTQSGIWDKAQATQDSEATGRIKESLLAEPANQSHKDT
jgi:hypothetical protein